MADEGLYGKRGPGSSRCYGGGGGGESRGRGETQLLALASLEEAGVRWVKQFWVVGGGV